MTLLPTAVDVADAVVAELRQGTFTPAFAPRRAILPYVKKEQLMAPVVTVAPRLTSQKPLTRDALTKVVTIQVAVQQWVQDIDADAPVVLALAEEIAEYLGHHDRRRLTALPNVTQTGVIRSDPLFDLDHLQQERIVTSILLIDYTAA